MYILPDHGLIYLAHPRMASVATKGVLVDKFGAQMVGDHHSGLAEPLQASWMAATTVRNPWDLMVSWWKKRDRDISLYDFIKEWYTNTHFCPDGKLFYHIREANFILRYEELQHQFDWLMTWVGLSPSKLDLRNVSPYRGDKLWQSFYDTRTYNLVRNLFGNEAEQYGYN